VIVGNHQVRPLSIEGGVAVAPEQKALV
jgi:hypothetical protein